MSDELTKTRDRGHNLINYVVASLLLGIGNGLFGKAGDFAHAEALAHQLLTETHNAAAAHRDEAGERDRTARDAELAAKEQSVQAERQRIEAEAQAERAQQDRAAADEHVAEARRIDPDTDESQDAAKADRSTASPRVD